MDGNKDAAQNCMDLGNKALKEGDKARAFKLLAKAQRLDPSLRLTTLLSSLNKDADSHGNQVLNNTYQNGSVKSRPTRVAPNVVASTEQVEIVRRIQKTKDYYQILGLNKESTAEEIRRAYKKISLKVHPDKNSTPGAEEAFKNVSKAFACLNDENLRAKYDRYGPEDPDKVARQNAARYHHGGSGFAFDEMFDADEIFNSFFATNFSRDAFQRAQYVRRYRTAASQQTEGSRSNENSGGLVTFLQILPVLALFLISLIPLSRPLYSMEQVTPYKFQYSTKEHQVPFFVKSVDFDRDYPPGSTSRRNVEAKVEKDHMEILGLNCRRELHHRRWNPSLKTPNCDRLQSYYVK